MRREVVETRVKLYPIRKRANYVMKQLKGKMMWIDDAGGEGREIVRELSLCARCLTPKD